MHCVIALNVFFVAVKKYDQTRRNSPFIFTAGRHGNITLFSAFILPSGLFIGKIDTRA